MKRLESVQKILLYSPLHALHGKKINTEVKFENANLY